MEVKGGNSVKKRIAIIIAIGLVLAAFAAGVTWYVLSTQVVKNDHPAATDSRSPYEKSVQVGIDAESKGETKKALDTYKGIRASCKDDDTNCKVNMDMKINLMESALKQEQKQKNAKAPTATVTTGGDPKDDITEANE